MTHREPHEPVSYQRVYDEPGYRPRRGGLNTIAAVLLPWEPPETQGIGGGWICDRIEVRLQSGALVIVKPRRRP